MGKSIDDNDDRRKEDKNWKIEIFEIELEREKKRSSHIKAAFCAFLLYFFVCSMDCEIDRWI